MWIRIIGSTAVPFAHFRDCCGKESGNYRYLTPGVLKKTSQDDVTAQLRETQGPTGDGTQTWDLNMAGAGIA